MEGVGGGTYGTLWGAISAGQLSLGSVAWLAGCKERRAVRAVFRVRMRFEWVAALMSPVAGTF